MAWVRMLKTDKGSVDGINIQDYEVDQEYDLPDSLVANFCDRDNPVAERIGEAAPDLDQESPDDGDNPGEAPETTSRRGGRKRRPGERS